MFLQCMFYNVVYVQSKVVCRYKAMLCVHKERCVFQQYCRMHTSNVVCIQSNVCM